MLDIRDIRIGATVEVRVPETTTWELAVVISSREVRWRGLAMRVVPDDVRPARVVPAPPCACCTCVACEFRMARTRRRRAA